MEETLAYKLVLAFNKPKVHCPHCAHEFTPTPVEQLNIHSVGGFEELLTPKARAVYERQEFSTVIEIVHCVQCDKKVTPKWSGGVSDGAEPSSVRVDFHPLHRLCPNNEDHDLMVHCKLMQFMAAVVHTSMQMEMVRPAGALEWEAHRCAQDMATIFNDAVEHDLIGHGCLLKLSMIPLATMELGQSASLVIFVAANVDREKLNERYGAELFALEGNIGVGAAAWRIAAKRLEEKK